MIDSNEATPTAKPATRRPRKMAPNPNFGTLLSQSLDAKKRAYTFGLPGEE